MDQPLFSSRPLFQVIFISPQIKDIDSFASKNLSFNQLFSFSYILTVHCQLPFLQHHWEICWIWHLRMEHIRGKLLQCVAHKASFDPCLFTWVLFSQIFMAIGKVIRIYLVLLFQIYFRFLPLSSCCGSLCLRRRHNTSVVGLLCLSTGMVCSSLSFECGVFGARKCKYITA